ncbi:MAG: CDP-alcohol phosphatidyltransferase family protein [Anaerolineales bacterium]|nr:CDP-alcohol phosphatidyltransferase family protein [Anaerolineales bacterium]
MQSQNPPAVRPATFTDRMRAQFKGVLDAVGGALGRLGISPNAVTLLGLAGSAAGAVLLALGKIPLGGWVILLSGATDALDGTLARLQGKASRFGAFLDSTADRFSEFFLFAGLGVHFALGADVLGVGLTFAAAIGSVMVSYEKARAEALGFECKVGLLTRMERYMVLCPLLILNLPLAAVGAVAVLGNFTALQRIWHVRGQAGGA